MPATFYRSFFDTNEPADTGFNSAPYRILSHHRQHVFPLTFFAEQTLNFRDFLTLQHGIAAKKSRLVLSSILSDFAAVKWS
jgi:hypothetical protein